MGIFSRLFGQDRPRAAREGYGMPYPTNDDGRTGFPAGEAPVQGVPTAPGAATPGATMTDDERAIARYEYMLKTAPPEQIEEAHAEAFAKLTPQQRQQVLQRLAQASPQDAPTSTDPRVLARSATRAEMRQPGILRTSFGGYGGFGGMGMGAGMGMGSMLLTSVAGAFIGTAIADAMFDGFDGFGNDFDSHDMQDAYQDGYADGADADAAGDNGGSDAFADTSSDGFDGAGFDSGDFGAGDFGGDMGGFDF